MGACAAKLCTRAPSSASVLGSAAMRTMIAMILMGFGVTACSKGENAGVEEARKEAEAAQEKKEQEPGAVAKKINPPVPGRGKLGAASVTDADTCTQAHA